MSNINELIKKCINHDEKSLSELYRNFSSKMFGICLRYAKNTMEAEDLLHDGFIRVLDNLKNFRFEGSFEGWLKKIMVTTAINYYHKAKSNQETEDVEHFQHIQTDEVNIISGISTDELLSYIHELPDGYRLVFNLYAIEGYKHREIAETLGISENTSRTQLLKARNTLRHKILSKFDKKEFSTGSKIFVNEEF